MIRRALVALCAVLLVVSTAGLAYASGLSLSAPTRPSLAIATKCDPQATITITGTTWRSPLTVSGLTPACGGLTLKVWLYDPGTGSAGPTTDMIETQVPHNGGDVSVPVTRMSVGPYTAGLVTVDTWPIPTTMDIRTPFVSCRTPSDLSAGCTAESTITNSWPNHWQMDVTIATTSDSGVTWEVMFNVADPMVPFPPTNYLAHYGALTRTSFAGCGATPRTVTASGHPDMHNQEIGGANAPASRQFGIWGTRNPQEDPSPTSLFVCPAE